VPVGGDPREGMRSQIISTKTVPERRYGELPGESSCTLAASVRQSYCGKLQWSAPAMARRKLHKTNKLHEVGG
jgi:hypothetical protein